MWARASLFRRFTGIQPCTEPVPLKYGKLATEIRRYTDLFAVQLVTAVPNEAIIRHSRLTTSQIGAKLLRVRQNEMETDRQKQQHRTVGLQNSAADLSPAL